MAASDYSSGGRGVWLPSKPNIGSLAESPYACVTPSSFIQNKRPRASLGNKGSQLRFSPSAVVMSVWGNARRRKRIGSASLFALGSSDVRLGETLGGVSELAQLRFSPSAVVMSVWGNARRRKRNTNASEIGKVGQ